MTLDGGIAHRLLRNEPAAEPYPPPVSSAVGVIGHSPAPIPRDGKQLGHAPGTVPELPGGLAPALLY